MRVLLTGASGFVGGHVATALHARGHALAALVRPTSARARLAPLDPDWVEVSLFDEDGLAHALRGVEAVVHAAGVTRAPDAATFHRVNAEASGTLARAAVRAGVRRVALIGSLAARGPDARGTTGDAPASPYGESKLEAERRLAREGAPLERVVLRPAAVYGPADADLRPLFAMAARGLLTLPPAELRFQPVFAPDLAQRVVDLLEAANPPTAPLPLAEPRAYAWREAAPLLRDAVAGSPRVLHLPPSAFTLAALVAQAWAAVTRSEPRLDLRRARDLSRHAFTVDPVEARDAWGDVAVTPLADGARQTFRWYRREGWA